MSPENDFSRWNSPLLYSPLTISAKKRKMNYLDFNGANSPNRGDDKHSYGAGQELFFEINY